MTASIPQKSEYRLFYQSSDEWVGCGFFAFAALVTLVFFMFAMKPFLWIVGVPVAVVSGYQSFKHARKALYLREHTPWYASFRRGLVQVNFQDYEKILKNKGASNALFDIPSDQITQIRKIKKRAEVSDEADHFYLEMTLEAGKWAAAKKKQTLCDPKGVARGFGIELFPDNILRLPLGRSFKSDIKPHLVAYDLPVANDYVV